MPGVKQVTYLGIGLGDGLTTGSGPLPALHNTMKTAVIVEGVTIEGGAGFMEGQIRVTLDSNGLQVNATRSGDVGTTIVNVRVREYE